jgi:FkbH-like protein
MTVEDVRLVVWDLDETFWKGTVTEGGIQEYVQAHHDIVIELARRGIMSSICSKNDSATIAAILAERGIADYFIFPSISWEPKGGRLARLVETVQLRAPTVMFIDDNPNNRAEAAAVVPGLQVEAETFIPNMLADRRFRGKSDPELTRLKQYKLLEARKRDEEQASGDNEAFLRSCNIRVYIEYDVEAHIDRAVELINRTNQLNYTKKRLPEDPEAARRVLRRDMQKFGYAFGLVRVLDRYGDYGFVGFFMITTGVFDPTLNKGGASKQLIHYCFSCRTLGMLIEDWVYNFLGRPDLVTVGEVLTDLTLQRRVDWVSLVTSPDTAGQERAIISPQIVLYGGCEAQAIGVYLQAYTDALESHGNYVADGIFVGVNYAAQMLDRCDRNPLEVASELDVFGLPAHMETGDIFLTCRPGAIFVVNFAMDAGGGDYLRHKRHDWTFLLSPNGHGWHKLYRTTDAELEEFLLSQQGRYTEAQKAQMRRASAHLRANYEEVTRSEGVETIDDLRNIVSRIPKGSKLIILVDHHQRRTSDNLEQIVIVSKVERYKSFVTEMASEYGYVAVVPISDFVHNVSEIIEGNHYQRQVYWRVAERVIEVAKALEPRVDEPESKRRISRSLLEARAERRAAIERERGRQGVGKLVEAVFQCMLRRDPDSVSGPFFEDAVVNGRMSAADFVRAIARTNEFRDKWVDPNKWVDPRRPKVAEVKEAAVGDD